MKRIIRIREIISIRPNFFSDLNSHKPQINNIAGIIHRTPRKDIFIIRPIGENNKRREIRIANIIR
ncbi:MAG: hypothetical protein V1660_00065 [archaeon]